MWSKKSEVVEIEVEIQARMIKKWGGTVVVKVIGRKLYEQKLVGLVKHMWKEGSWGV